MVPADNLSYMGELFFSEDNLKDPSKGASAEEVIAHEIVHQWWGSQCPIMDLEKYGLERGSSDLLHHIPDDERMEGSGLCPAVLLWTSGRRGMMI